MSAIWTLTLDTPRPLPTYRSENTNKAIQQHLRVFSAWYRETFDQPLNPRHLTNYDLHLYRRHSLDVEKVKASTWNARLWALTVLARSLGDENLLEGIEGKDFGVRSTKHRSLTENEYHRLNHAMEIGIQRAVTDFERRNAVRAWACASLMLQAGLRVDEVASLNRDDITLGERSGNVRVRDGKGSKERDVPLNLHARRALRAWNELRASATADDLFGVTARTMQRIISDLGAEIGVPDLTPHWLRYSFAKRRERKGIPIEQIRDLLGHTSIETTRRYLRSSYEELQSAVED